MKPGEGMGPHALCLLSSSFGTFSGAANTAPFFSLPAPIALEKGPLRHHVILKFAVGSRQLAATPKRPL
jgi:hypothetical protein